MKVSRQLGDALPRQDLLVELAGDDDRAGREPLGQNCIIKIVDLVLAEIRGALRRHLAALSRSPVVDISAIRARGGVAAKLRCHP